MTTSTAKKPGKKNVAKGKAKATKTKSTAKTNKGTRPPKDDARKVAKMTEGKLSADQIRMLRVLNNGKQITRDQLKAAMGMAPEAKYSSKWLQGLWALNKPLGYIDIEEEVDGRKKHWHKITASGKNALAKFEKLAKEAAKAAK